MPNKEGFGFLYPKKDRQGSQPNLTGKVVINGRLVELAAWKKKSNATGVPYLSLKAQDKGPPEDDSTDAVDDILTRADEDIPF